MFKPRTTESRLDSLLRKQAQSLGNTDGWKGLRAEMRGDKPSSRRIEELKSQFGETNNRSFASEQRGSPIRERLAAALQRVNQVPSLSALPVPRHQSPFAHARENFASFYESLSTPPETSPIQRSAAPPRSPTNLSSRLKELTKRSMSPTRAESLPEVLSLDAVLMAKGVMQKRGLKNEPQTYVSELKAFCKLVLAHTADS